MRSPRFKSLAAQAFACAVVAATILAVAYAMAPNATPTAVRVTYIFAHEVGHLIGATAVGHSWVDFQITRDSGHVITSGGRETVVVILMGPLFPAMVAALALTLAAIQRWNVALLVTFGGSALVATILGGPFEQAVDWTLYAIAGLGALSLAPLWPWMRAIPTFLLGMVLSIGVLESTRHFGRETLDQAQMSDAMQLAAQLAPADPTSALGDVRVIVIGLIVLIYLIITIIAANLLLHERTTP